MFQESCLSVAKYVTYIESIGPDTVKEQSWKELQLLSGETQINTRI